MRVISTIALCALLLSGLPVSPQDDSSSSTQEMTAKAERAVEKGTRWLAKNQNRNGSFGSGSAPVATTSIAGIAWFKRP